jgi:hypothetical protein
MRAVEEAVVKVVEEKRKADGEGQGSARRRR